MNSERPVDITIKRQSGEFIVTWDDDHISRYPFSLLRNGCPCADCRGGHDNMSSKPDPNVFAMPLEDSSRTRIVNVEQIGSYAISITWEDGHNAGIYPWSYLRELCPCPICRGETLFQPD